MLHVVWRDVPPQHGRTRAALAAGARVQDREQGEVMTPIDRARDIIERYLPPMPDQMAAFVTRDAARAIDAAGLLVTPEHDAAVAARAWDEGRRTAGVILPTDPPKPPRNPYREWGGSDV